MQTNYVRICSWIFLYILVPLIVSILDIFETAQGPLSFCNIHFDDDPCTSSLSAENAPIHSSRTSFYTYMFLNLVPVRMHDDPFPLLIKPFDALWHIRSPITEKSWFFAMHLRHLASYPIVIFCNSVVPQFYFFNRSMFPHFWFHVILPHDWFHADFLLIVDTK